VKGGIYRFRGDHLELEAAWTEGRVFAAQRGRHPFAGFARQPDGRWKGGWDHANQTVLLVVDGPRLAGPSVDVSLTRVTGGFRIAGLWGGDHVDLLLDATGARAEGRRWTWEAPGVLVSDELPPWKLVLYGEAARLEAPPWPEFALAALSAGWGVQR
jgi:hypothetical protein